MNLTWVKSRRCDSNACVEVARNGDQVYLRDSKDPTGPVLKHSGLQWRDLLQDIKTGNFGPTD